VKSTHPDAPILRVTQYILSGARTSRLTQAIVYAGEIGTTAQAFSQANRLDGSFTISATARPGKGLDTLKTTIDATLQRLAIEGPTPRELEQARNAIEAGFLRSIQTVSGKADQLNSYYYQTGNPDGFQADLDRLRAVSSADIQRIVRTYLQGSRVMISVVPQGKQTLAATKKQVAQ
jgi:zinc protease